MNRLYCLNCKTNKCPACNTLHSSTTHNTIVVLCNDDEDDPDHKSRWFILDKDCYQSNESLLGLVNSWNCLQDIKDKQDIDRIITKSTSDFVSCREKMVNITFIPRVLATTDDDTKKKT